MNFREFSSKSVRKHDEFHLTEILQTFAKIAATLAQVFSVLKFRSSCPRFSGFIEASRGNISRENVRNILSFDANVCRTCRSRKCCNMNIDLQASASIQPRTSLSKIWGPKLTQYISILTKFESVYRHRSL